MFLYATINVGNAKGEIYMQTNEKEEIVEAQEIPEEKKESKGAKALRAYRESLTPEQKQANIEKARETRLANAKEKREIEVATRTLMNQKYRYRNKDGKLEYGNGYEARANALFLEVVSRGKNMIGAEKQLNLYLGENKEEEDLSAKTINVVFIEDQHITV